MDTKNLKLRYRSWYARLRVPPSLRESIGKTELVRTLNTRDLAEANRRKHAVLAEMQAQLSQAAARATLPRESAEFILHAAKDLAAAVKEGESTMRNAEAALSVALDDHLETQARKHGRDPKIGDPLLPEAHERTLRLAFKVLHSGDVALLSQSTKDYLAEKAPHINKQTKAEKERQLEELAAWLGGDCEVGTVTKKSAGRYVTEKLLKKGHAPKTVKDTLSNLSAFWRWLEGRGLVEFNVWQGMASTVRGSTKGTKPKRRPWTDEEVLKLVSGIPTSDPLWSMSVIAAYTGMRREEIARLRTEDVHADDALDVREGKTAAAVRRIPIHPALKPLVMHLKDTSRDGYLIPGLLTGGSDEKRGHYVGKRFTEFRRSLGLNGADTVFHSFRKALAQRCEDAEVPESTVKLIGGWSRGKQMAYGIYSPGPKFEVLRKGIHKATYGKVDALVKKLGMRVEITKTSRRRPRASYNRKQRVQHKRAA